VEAPEAEFRWLSRERDGKDTTAGKEKEEEDLFEKERKELAGKSGTGMRLVELDGRRDGPIDHGECRDLLKVSPWFIIVGRISLTNIDRMQPTLSKLSLWQARRAPTSVFWRSQWLKRYDVIVCQ
jgi:hypothetical protein